MWVKVYRKSARTIGARCRFEVIIDVASFWIGGVCVLAGDQEKCRLASGHGHLTEPNLYYISFSKSKSKPGLFAWQMLTLGSWNVPADEQTNHKYSECWTMGYVPWDGTSGPGPRPRPALHVWQSNWVSGGGGGGGGGWLVIPISICLPRCGSERRSRKSCGGTQMPH